MLTDMVRNMVRFLLLQPQARLVAGFMLREMAQPSSALDLIYDGLFVHVHRRACAVWAAATGQQPESEAVRLAVFSAIGQVVYFHVGRPIVQRRMGWPEHRPRPRPRPSPTRSRAACWRGSTPTRGTGHELPLRPAAGRAAAGLRRARRARRRLCRGRVRQPRPGHHRRAHRGRGAPGRPRDPGPGRSPARSAPTPRSRWPRPRPPAARPRPSSPTCARAAARRRSG